MSEIKVQINNQINNLTKTIEQKQNKIIEFQNNLKQIPEKNRQKHHDVKRIILLRKNIEELTSQKNRLKELEGRIDNQRRIPNTLNRNISNELDDEARNLGIDVNPDEELEEADKQRQLSEKESGRQTISEIQNENLNLENPTTIQPPTIQPPTIQSPTIQPPTIQPPTIQPPTIQPPPKTQKTMRINPISPQIQRPPSPINSGFRETIVPRIDTSSGPMRPNMTLCPKILDTGKKVNDKFFIPSQFPNLTKPKLLVVDIKTQVSKGGKKSRKNMNRKGKKGRKGRKSCKCNKIKNY